jgi:hypothetical protein
VLVLGPVLVVMLALMLGVFIASNAASGHGAGGNDGRGAALLKLVGTGTLV